jgi:hypothetical protein
MYIYIYIHTYWNFVIILIVDCSADSTQTEKKWWAIVYDNINIINYFFALIELNNISTYRVTQSQMFLTKTQNAQSEAMTEMNIYIYIYLEI